MRSSREVRSAVDTLEILRVAHEDEPEKHNSTELALGVVYWFLKDKRGDGFGKFIALTACRVDQIRMEERDSTQQERS